MSPFEFTCVKGDDVKICVHCVDNDGNPIDLTPYTSSDPGIRFALKFSTQDDDGSATFIGTLFNGDIEISEDQPEDGICTITVPGDDTANMMVYRPYYWNISLIDDLGAITTPVQGTLIAMLNPQ